MAESSEIKRFGTHQNAFGFLRLLFASLVIVSHTPEMADGNRNREILTRLFGTISFGEFAVDGFFVISGYLIVGSFIKSPEAIPYLLKRVGRIYPAFVAASLICAMFVAQLAGATAGQIHSVSRETVKRIISLQPPMVPGVFSGSSYPDLNGAMWTISYEFKCYLLVLALGLVGAFRHRQLVAGITILALCGFAIWPSVAFPGSISALSQSYLWLGDAAVSLRLAGVFLTGSLFYLWRDKIRFTTWGAVGATIALILCLRIKPFAEPGLAIFGGYLIFSFARWGSSGFFSQINNENDISYGVYLYAWPVAKLLLWYYPAMPLWIIALLTFFISCLCGWLSWHLLERRVMAMVHRVAGRRSGRSETHQETSGSRAS